MERQHLDIEFTTFQKFPVDFLLIFYSISLGMISSNFWNFQDNMNNKVINHNSTGFSGTV